MFLIKQLSDRLHAGSLGTSMENWEKPMLFPTATVKQLSEAEAKLGFALPALLREIYLQIGNGGFGPGYGLIGVEGGAADYVGDREFRIVDLYLSFRARCSRGEPWGEALLPICHWGCGIYSYIDCALPEAPVMAIDQNRHGHGPWECSFSLHAHSLESWMQCWLEGDDLWNSIGLSGEPIVWFEEHGPNPTN